MIECEMDGKPYLAARFAKQWRHQVRPRYLPQSDRYQPMLTPYARARASQLMKEHLGLLPPQGTHPFGEDPKPAMKPAPHEHEDFFETDADKQVSDPLSDDFLAVSRVQSSLSPEPAADHRSPA
jgi:hypothetical protein